MSTVRPGTDVMANVGDCSKLKLDEIDLISRTLKCEVEIFHYDDKLSFTSVQGQGDGAEEEEVSVPTTENGTDEADQLDQSIGDIDCVLQRIEQLQLQVEMRKEKLLSQSKASSMTSLDCEEKLQISNLQNDHYHLQCEIERVSFCYQELRIAMHESMKLMCQLERELELINEIAEESKEWAGDIANFDLDVCAKRHQELGNKMITKNEINTVTKSYMEIAFKRSVKCLKKHLINDELNKFQVAIDELMQFTQDLAAEMSKRYAKLEKTVKLYIQRLEGAPEN